MLPETHPLIQTVTEPLADNAEQRMAASAFLEETLDSGHPGVAETAARLEAADSRRFDLLPKFLIWLLAAFALASIAPSSFMPSWHTAKMIFNFDLLDPGEKPELPAGLTEEERLLLGDTELENLEGKRRLHLLDPENPGYFVEYIETYVSVNNELPPDFQETVADIDPDNAFHIYYTAGSFGKESVTRKRRTGPRPPMRYQDGVRLDSLWGASEYDITDPAAFEEALEQIAEATKLPGFESYVNPMTAARMKLLPSGTLVETMESLMHGYGSSSGLFKVRHILDLLCARAEQLSKDGRKEEFVALAAQRDAFISHLGNNPDRTIFGERIHGLAAFSTAIGFHFAADRLGLSELAETYGKQKDAFQRERDLSDIRKAKEEDSFPEERASAMAAVLLPLLGGQAGSPPPVSTADLKPMRMAEHELLGGFGILAIALLIPVAAMALFLFRFVATPMIRLPSKRMSGVLNAVDWLWIIGLGVMLPIALFLIVSRLTPLGGRGYGTSHFRFLLPGVHLVALLLGLLTAPALLVRWRLSHRLAPFRLSDRFSIPLTVASLALILVWALAALPFVLRFGTGKFSLIALAAPPAICLALVFANALRSILGKPTTRLAQSMTTLAVLPAYPVAIIALCALMPFYTASERHWIAQDTLFHIDPDSPDLGAYEFKVAARMRKEINAISGIE